MLGTLGVVAGPKGVMLGAAAPARRRRPPPSRAHTRRAGMALGGSVGGWIGSKLSGVSTRRTEAVVAEALAATGGAAHK